MYLKQVTFMGTQIVFRRAYYWTRVVCETYPVGPMFFMIRRFQQSESKAPSEEIGEVSESEAMC